MLLSNYVWLSNHVWLYELYLARDSLIWSILQVAAVTQHLQVPGELFWATSLSDHHSHVYWCCQLPLLCLHSTFPKFFVLPWAGRQPGLHQCCKGPASMGIIVVATANKREDTDWLPLGSNAEVSPKTWSCLPSRDSDGRGLFTRQGSVFLGGELQANKPETTGLSGGWRWECCHAAVPETQLLPPQVHPGSYSFSVPMLLTC